MKRLLPLLLLFLLPFLAKTQTTFPDVVVPEATISAMQSYTGTHIYVVVQDTATGGLFYYTTASLISDNIRVFTSVKGGFWVKIANWSSGGGSTPNYWTLNGDDLFPTETTNYVGIGNSNPAHRFDVSDSLSKFYFDNGHFVLYDNEDSLNALIGRGAGNFLQGSANHAFGNKALRYSVGSYNVGIGTNAGGQAIGDANISIGRFSNQFALRGYNTSLGYGSNASNSGYGNTAIGANANAGAVIYSASMATTNIDDGTATITGTDVADFITNAPLSLGDTVILQIVFNGAIPAPYIETANRFSGVVTDASTISFLNADVFEDQGTGTMTVYTYQKIDSSTAIGLDAVATNSRQLALSPYMDTINAPGMATSTGWVLTDVNGDGKLTLQPGSGASMTANNGLNKNTATNVQIGGSFIKNTDITGDLAFGFTIDSLAYLKLEAAGDTTSNALEMDSTEIRFVQKDEASGDTVHQIFSQPLQPVLAIPQPLLAIGTHTDFFIPVGVEDAGGTHYADAAGIIHTAGGAGFVDTANVALVATTEALPAVTYDNGTGGVGATLTADAVGALPPIDGVTLAPGSKVLIKDQLSQLENGFYIVTDPGSDTTAFVLTRATNADATGELYPEIIAISSGLVNGGYIFQQTTVAPTVGTNNLIYVLFFITDGGVQSVTGLNTDNTDPLNPIVKISVDGVTITGLGTPGSPLVAVGGGGGGSVSTFLADDLPTLFTTSVDSPSTAPFLHFTLSNAGPYQVWGRASGVGTPSYLSSLDSNWIPDLHTQNYYDLRYFLALSAIGAVPNANGATLTGNTLNLQPASAAFGGVVTTSAQTLGAGDKRFTNKVGIGATPAWPLDIGLNITASGALAKVVNVVDTITGASTSDNLYAYYADPVIAGNGAILTGSVVAGSGYTNGTYTAVPLTNVTGSGTGAVATVQVITNGVWYVAITTKGTGYAVGDSLTASAVNIGGTVTTAFRFVVREVGYTTRHFDYAGTHDAIFNSVRIGKGAANFSENTAVGVNALGTPTTAFGINNSGNDNTAFGYNTLQNNTLGQMNNAFGARALSTVTTGYGNIAIGYQALAATSTGFENIAIGNNANGGNTTGSNNIFIGGRYFTGSGVGGGSTASNNIGIGSATMVSNSTGTLNVAMGINTLLLNSTGSRNIAIGHIALQQNTTGNDNTALGYSALNGYTGVASQNTALGASSGGATGTNNNTWVGYASGTYGANGGGGQNTAVGSNSQNVQSTGADNTSIGFKSLNSITNYIKSFLVTNGGSGYTTATVSVTNSISTGGGTNIVGTAVISGGVITGINIIIAGTAYSTTTPTVTITGDGTGATAVAVMAPTSSKNVAVGSGAGQYIADGSTILRTLNKATMIGTDTKALAQEDSNFIALGYNVIGKGSNTVNIGDANIVSTSLHGALLFDNTVAATTGAQTINKPSGSVIFAAGASSLVVTNSYVTTSSQVFVQVYGSDATFTTARVSRASGSFTITANAAATAQTTVGFFVINQ